MHWAWPSRLACLACLASLARLEPGLEIPRHPWRDRVSGEASSSCTAVDPPEHRT